MAERKSNFKTGEFLRYKGRPLVRSGNTLYYGNMYEKCVIMLEILTEKEVNGEKQADRVWIQLISTDESLPPAERILNKSEKTGLYNALDVASIWLERELGPVE